MRNSSKGIGTLMKSSAYEREMLATEVGRQSDALRQRGHEEIASGINDKAFAHFLAAADLFETTDMGAAAAACWFDLAEAYRQRLRGTKLENLRSAEGLFRRAMKSPARERDPHRAALTRTQLAACLRHLARQPSEMWRAQSLLDEAHRLLLEAIRLQEVSGLWGWADVAGAFNNLGCLFQQCGRHAEATRAYEQGLRFARQLLTYERKHTDFKRSFRSNGDVLTARLLVNLASHLFHYVPTADRGQIRRHFEEVCSLDLSEWRSMAHLGLAELFLTQNQPEARARAKRELEVLDWESLPATQFRRAARLYVATGLGETAERLLTTAIVECIKDRVYARADHVADAQSKRAQELSNILARVHAADPDQAVHAFLALERTSSLRFMESWLHNAWYPNHPLDRALLHRQRELSHCSALLGEKLGFLKALPAPLMRLALMEMAFEQDPANNETLPLDMEHWPIGFFPRDVQRFHLIEAHLALEQAAKEPDPLGYLEARSEALATIVIRMSALLAGREPDLAHQRSEQDQPLALPDLEALLRREPGTVLLRISLDEDLLLAAVWLENGHLKARSVQQSLPDGWVERMQAIFSQQQQADQGTLPSTLEADLQMLDFTSVLPEGQCSKVAVLPSLIASWLPLAALGPRGRTLLDRFDEVTWLPCLDPLRTHAGACPPRNGTLTVAPDSTHFHSLALRDSLPHETQLRSKMATMDAVVSGAFSPDVISFFTHGAANQDDQIELQLSDSPLMRHWLDGRWQGLERVELWACQTGVNVPWHPLTPLHDEAFGLDVEFLKIGVRSAIGSLWKIPDFVTASLVHRYREGLRAGKAAPRALADAQRWWRDTGISELRTLLLTLPEGEAIARFTANLGATNIQVGITELETLLGPVPPGEGTRTPADIQTLLQRLASPVSWAGLRFIGVSEHRPQDPWTPDHFRSLTQEEQGEFERIMASLMAPPQDKPICIDTAQERHLAELTTSAGAGALNPSLAIEVARSYQARLHSARSHNLLSALAWLHEALALPNLTTVDVNALRLEAAWLWIELATPECFPLPLGHIILPDPVLLRRGERLLQKVPDCAESRAALSWLRLLQGLSTANRPDEEGMKSLALDTLAAALELTLPEAGSFRATIAACELMLLSKSARKLDGNRLLAHAEMLLSQRGGIRIRDSQWFLEHRLAAIVEQLRLMETKSLPNLTIDVSYLAPRDMARAISFFQTQQSFSMGDASLRLTDLYGSIMTSQENAIWGDLDDQETPAVRFTGTTGQAYRAMLGHYVQHKLMSEPYKQGIEHYIAAVQGNADLHLMVQRRLSRATGLLRGAGHRRLKADPQPEEISKYQWLDDVLHSFIAQLRIREHLLLALQEAAGLKEMGDLTTRAEQQQLAKIPVQPAARDPFGIGAAQLMEDYRHIGDRLPWLIGADVQVFVEKQVGPTHTAAFQLVRGVEEISKELLKMSEMFGEMSRKVREAERSDAADPMRGLFDAGRSGRDNEKLLRSLPPGLVMISVSPGDHDAFVFLAHWNLDGKLGGNHHILPDEESNTLRHRLADLFLPLENYDDVRFSRAGRRALTWEESCRQLAVVLEQLLEPVRAHLKGMHIRIFMPGSFRSFPWSAVQLWGRPLYQYVTSFQHILTVDSNPADVHFAPGPVTRTACLVTDLETDQAETGFGLASVTSLRRWFPPGLKLEQVPSRSDDIVEATALEASSFD